MKLPKELQEKYKLKKKKPFPKSNLSKEKFIGPIIFEFEPDAYNPIRKFYQDVKTFNEDSLLRVKKEIQHFIINSKIQPGILNEDKTKLFCKSIFDFLLKKLKKELVKYDDGILIFAFQQREIIEANRFVNYTNLATCSNDKILLQKRELISSISRSISYILTLLLQKSINGREIITDNEWTYLLSLSYILNSMANIYDDIQYMWDISYFY